MMQDFAQTVEVTATYFVPGTKVELVLRRPQLYDGLNFRLNETVNELTVSLSPLMVMNHTTAIF
jgi:hypothetical protein